MTSLCCYYFYGRTFWRLKLPGFEVHHSVTIKHTLWDITVLHVLQPFTFCSIDGDFSKPTYPLKDTDSHIQGENFTLLITSATFSCNTLDTHLLEQNQADAKVQDYGNRYQHVTMKTKTAIMLNHPLTLDRSIYIVLMQDLFCSIRFIVVCPKR